METAVAAVVALLLCVIYVQPEVPRSFAPIRRYCKPTIPMDDNTTYQLSYWEGPSTITDPIYPRNWLVTGDSAMSDETTYKNSYLNYLCVKPVESITPCQKQWLGRGPMQDVTTQKHDYTWKSIKTTPPYTARNNIFCHPAPLTDNTTYKLSYFESCCRTPAKSFAPIRKYVRPELPFENHTTYSLSYWPNDMPMKEESWAPKREYLPPVVPLDGCTTYRLSYYPHAGKKSLPIIPERNPNPLNVGCFKDRNTTYRLSYFGCEDRKREPIIQPGNITFSTCPPAYDTIHRMSFLGNWNVKPVEPITPCAKQMLGRGLMQDVTTQKHDYSWKLLKLRPPYRPTDNLMPACAPVECCTTHRMSFVPSDLKSLTPVPSFAPIRVYKPPEIPLNAETTMNLSYQPTDGATPAEKICKTVPYQTPVVPIDGHTTYNTSYFPPGTLVPCSEKPKPCITPIPPCA